MESSVKVVPLFDGQRRYIDAARANPHTPLAALWEECVIAPCWDLWGAGQFNQDRVRQNLATPVSDLDGLEKIVDALLSSNIATLVQAAYHQITRLLPSSLPDRAVAVMALDPLDHHVSETMGGVVGECVGDNILLRVNPVSGWKAWLEYTLAHEYHHAAWGYLHYAVKGRQGWQLLDALVTEGEADSFARLLYSQIDPPWLRALTPQQEIEQWQAIKPLLSSGDGSLYPRFMFGDTDTATPPGTGYTIGYHCVQSYLRGHPQETVADWTDRDPLEILSGSGYQGVF